MYYSGTYLAIKQEQTLVSRQSDEGDRLLLEQVEKLLITDNLNGCLWDELSRADLICLADL